MTVTDIERVEMSPEDFAAAESVIERGLGTFVEVGQALLAIRNGNGHYIHAGYADFGDYVRQRWEMSWDHAGNLMNAARVVAAIPTIVGTPANEAQARPLAKVLKKDGPVAVAEVWQEAVDTAPNGKVTAAHVQEVVERHNEVVATKRLNESETVATSTLPPNSRVAIQQRRDTIARMAAERYSEHAIAQEVGMGVERVRMLMHREGIPTLEERLGRGGRPKLGDSNRAMEGIVSGAMPSMEAIGALDWSKLDRSRFPEWEHGLTEAIRELSGLRARLRKEAQA